MAGRVHISRDRSDRVDGVHGGLRIRGRSVMRRREYKRIVGAVVLGFFVAGVNLIEQSDTQWLVAGVAVISSLIGYATAHSMWRL